MISENAVRLSVKEGAKIFSEEPIPRQARDALEKGIKLAEAGIKLAKNVGLATAPELMGSLLCARAQGLTLKARFEEALSCADEAVLIYRDLGCSFYEMAQYFVRLFGDVGIALPLCFMFLSLFAHLTIPQGYQLEANALMLTCDNLRALERVKEAVERKPRAVEENQIIRLPSGFCVAVANIFQAKAQFSYWFPTQTTGYKAPGLRRKTIPKKMLFVAFWVVVKAWENTLALRQAAEAADEALALYRHVDDTAGENLALEVIATFQERCGWGGDGHHGNDRRPIKHLVIELCV